MNKTFIFGMVLIALVVCVSSAAAQDTVTRDLPESADPGTPITVNLTVGAETDTTYYAIDEVVPPGWTITNATGGGDYTSEPGHVKWVVTSGAADIVYSYTVDIPADAAGTYTFDGTYAFEGMTEEATILGDTEVNVGDGAADTVTRDLPESADPGTPITVNLTVGAETDTTYYAIDEVVPPGWTITNATGGGDYTSEPGHVKWVVTSGAADIVYSYTVDIPADAAGTYTFDGTYAFEGMTEEATILGDTEITVDAIVPPKLVSCIIDPTPPVVPGTNVSVDCLFSETVNYEIRIENDTGMVEVIGIGTAKDPDPKWWNTTNETTTGIYTVNVTMHNSTTGLSSYNDTNTIRVNASVVDTTSPYTSGRDPAPDAAGVPIDTDVTVHVLDDGTGVNVSTIAMTVNDTVVTPEITGTPADYTLVYDADFNYDQLVNVTIDASDLAGNAMHDAYSFTTAVNATRIVIDDAIASTGGNDDVTQVMINNVVNVGVVRIDIHYDPSVVWVVDVADGDFDFITSSIDNAAGVVRIGVMQVASSGLNGYVLLAEVTLQAKGDQGNTSALSIDIKELKDATPQCNPIQTGVEDGIFTVSCLCGDVNEDGNVLLDDAMYLVKHCVKEPGFEQISECASDVDCDGAMEMADAMYLAKHCVGVPGFEKLYCCAG